MPPQLDLCSLIKLRTDEQQQKKMMSIHKTDTHHDSNEYKWKKSI